MGDTITFNPNTGVNPTFVGQGSKIEHPDILPIFRGAYWPGTDDVTVRTIMNALYSIVSGPYLEGLKEYGYSGSASVRDPVVDPFPVDINLPMPAPGVEQISTVDDWVYAYIDWLVRNEKIDNVDDNHDLLVLVFLDPSVPQPIDTDQTGKATMFSGANNSIERFEFLDDNTRFEYAWITTTTLTLGDITRTLSHELVEGITDPFNTGWEQTSPSPGENLGQIADVCNQPGIVNGVAVVAYWSVQRGACVIPTTSTRQLSLSYTLDKHEPHDGPPRTGCMDLPLICGGWQCFSFVERTYQNQITVHADFSGYESPEVDYTINGQQVPFMQGDIEVEATWDEPRSNPLFPDLNLRPATAHLRTLRLSPAGPLTIFVGPNEGNTAPLHVVATVQEVFDDPNVGGEGTTRRTAYTDIDVKNQEIIWDSQHDDAVNNCNRLTHLADGGGLVIGPPQPGDPPNLRGIVFEALRDRGDDRVGHLRHVSELVAHSRPEVAQALQALAERAQQVQQALREQETEQEPIAERPQQHQ